MAEGRMLKKKISLNEALANLENDTHRLLFTWAIPHLDVEGRITGSPRVFKATVAPLLDHLSTEIILCFFQDAHRNGLLVHYQVDGWWIQFPKFKENQNLKEGREAASKIPPPPENSSSIPITPENSGELLRTPDDSGELPNTPPKLREVKLREDNKDLADSPPANCRNFTQEFDGIFYPAYPNKKKPAHAKQAYIAKGKKGRLPPVQDLVSALEVQKVSDDWTKEGGRYIPHPSTWINGEQWLNRPVEVAPKRISADF
jgi:hypothetical protein